MLRTEVPWMHNFRHMFEHVKRLSLDHTSTDPSIFLSRLRLDSPKLERSMGRDLPGAWARASLYNGSSARLEDEN
ncbi:hypothetical protein BELL_0024g00340 [Botrytis elliptica]|uniref:Uncharacterized protein n=1 Tax=Botrytis elliptica TaxID=278938 RepID=A0A4Z1K1I6_9HELO|nr:hypothetical protein BELL_0024g00340 [Botrytis elliptica]